MPQAQSTCLEAFYEAHLLTEVFVRAAFPSRLVLLSWIFFRSRVANS
jgi:hypothetical protein